eukprot:5424147-Pyramimonas_sp.AAC.1
MHGRIADRVSRLWARMQEIYDEQNLPHRSSNFKLSMFLKDKDSPRGEYPVLAHSIKAAEARTLGRV